MAKKYTKLGKIALAQGTSAASGTRISPGDLVTAEVARLTDSILLSEVEVGDVIYIAQPMRKGIRPNLTTSRLTVFGDTGMVLTGTLGYETLDGKTVKPSVYGAACTSNRGAITTAPVDSFPPVGDVEKLPNQAWLIFTVATVTNPLTTVTAVPASAERGRAYFAIECSLFN